MRCLLCGGSLTSFLDLGKQPLANKYPTREEFETEDFFPLQVFFCTSCKNVQLGKIVSRERMFVDYYYLSSVNPGLVRHFESFANKLAGASFVVDIGSNDGILLKPLKALGVKALGVDPSVNVSKIANDAGLTTLTSFFNAAAVADIVRDYGKADVVAASSIFTHVEDPHQFLEDVKDLMAEGGAFIVEVEYIRDIIENARFERFYFDRPFYYSLSSLRDLFAAHDMYLSDAERITPHGGSIRVTARIHGSGSAPTERAARLIAEEETALALPVFETFRKTAADHIAAFRETLEGYKRSGFAVAGYGAPARTATICNFGDIGPSLIAYIVDDSPLKQHRHSPGTHIPIVPRQHLAERKPEILIVFAHEYLDDIREKIGESKYRYVIPIPTREVV